MQANDKEASEEDDLEGTDFDDFDVEEEEDEGRLLSIYNISIMKSDK